MRTALVTGSTDGHGRLVARWLAGRGYRVLVHGRDVERGRAVLGELEGEGHELLLADLSSKAGAHRLVRDVLAYGGPELLVNNAGVASDVRRESADGIELSFAVNHLAHVIVTEELVRAGAPVQRVVNVASIAQAPFDWDDPLLERSYEGLRAYAQSKLAQVAFTFDLAELWADRGITVDAIHPATLMDTAMVRDMFGQVQATVEEGAAATLALIESPGTGRFWSGPRETKANPAAYDLGERERIHALTKQLLG